MYKSYEFCMSITLLGLVVFILIDLFYFHALVGKTRLLTFTLPTFSRFDMMTPMTVRKGFRR